MFQKFVFENVIPADEAYFTKTKLSFYQLNKKIGFLLFRFIYVNLCKLHSQQNKCIYDMKKLYLTDSTNILF